VICRGRFGGGFFWIKRFQIKGVAKLMKVNLWEGENEVSLRKLLIIIFVYRL
jgi:hypothetical protein